MPARRKSKPRSPHHAALGEAIDLVITETANMTQASVAADSGLDIRRVSALACGQANPTYETMTRLSKGLHVSLGELLTKVDALREINSQR